MCGCGVFVMFCCVVLCSYFMCGCVYLLCAVLLCCVVFCYADDVHPQTVECIRTRAVPLGVEVKVMSADKFDFSSGVLWELRCGYGFYGRGTFFFPALLRGSL